VGSAKRARSPATRPPTAAPRIGASRSSPSSECPAAGRDSPPGRVLPGHRHRNSHLVRLTANTACPGARVPQPGRPISQPPYVALQSLRLLFRRVVTGCSSATPPALRHRRVADNLQRARATAFAVRCRRRGVPSRPVGLLRPFVAPPEAPTPRACVVRALGLALARVRSAACATRTPGQGGAKCDQGSRPCFSSPAQRWSCWPVRRLRQQPPRCRSTRARRDRARRLQRGRA